MIPQFGYWKFLVVQERGDCQEKQRAKMNFYLDIGHSLLDIGYSKRDRRRRCPNG
jgi:hypothetical protein